MPEMIDIAQYRAKIYGIKESEAKVIHCVSCAKPMQVPDMFSNIKVTGKGKLNLKCKCGRLNEYKGD